LNFSEKHKNLILRCLRFLFVFALFAVQALSLSSCSILKNTPSQTGKLEYKKTGLASYYSNNLKYRKTASGMIFDNNSMTAAHKTLPFGTDVIVKNINNGKSVKVKINDRGPYIESRIIDLSRAAFAKIENLEKGFAKVEILVVD
jgi:rare lipoprotein A